jgi:DNA-binding CsgD family transcriptional regulator
MRHMNRIESARRRVTDACRRATTPTELLEALSGALRRDVPADRWCAMTLDPATTLPTGGVHEHGVSAVYAGRILELEFVDGDVIGLAQLARAGDGVATLHGATGGQPQRSARFREVLVPNGLTHELRAVFRDAHGAWAALILFRGDAAHGFSAPERALIAAVAEPVTHALRRVLLLGEADAQANADAPALLLVGGDGQLQVRHASAGAARWLEQIEDGTAGPLPYSLYSLAQRARGSGSAVVRLRTRSGRWLTAHAESAGGGEVSLILAPSRPHEIASVLSGAYALTPREAEVARLVAAGCSNPEIAQLLFISRHTVEDHLKKLYAKLAVNSRSELVARLFFDQYLPRTRAGLGLDAQGWYQLPTAGHA